MARYTVERTEVLIVIHLIHSLAKEVSHVDAYGFRHSHSDEGMILHYICRQLWEHYVLQLR